MKVCLVASSGGHLLELVSLRKAWEPHERFWVTFPTDDAKALLQGERVSWAFHPTNRSMKNLMRNLWLAWRLLRREHPEVVLSTGAGVAVPFLWMGRVLRMRTVYIESLARIDTLSLSGRLVYPVVNQLFVQWPELARKYRRAVYAGQIV